MSNIVNVSRRNVLKGIAGAGGFVLGLKLAPRKGSPFIDLVRPASADTTLNPNLFVSIDSKGLVTIIAHRSEMGQGARTSVPMILADELEADWSRVVIEQAVGDKQYGNQYTDGSRSIRHNFQRMREFGAVARTMLEQAAAKQWGVNASECKGKNHQVVHVPSGKTLDYGALVDTAASLPVPDAKQVRLKAPTEFRYIGKDLPIVDLPDMVRGTAIYSIDVRLPGMKYASVEHCPVTYGTVKSYDATEALKVPGVERVLAIPHTAPPIVFNTLGGIAVVASNTWSAVEGRKKLKIEWDYGDNVVLHLRVVPQRHGGDGAQAGPRCPPRGGCRQSLRVRRQGCRGRLLRAALCACHHGAASSRGAGRERQVRGVVRLPGSTSRPHHCGQSPRH
jgi:isoquinoline 1-oxidoreductase subunit beta